ncbi:MAG: HrpB1 family type III secretion system apparatus protein [Pararobbsia sp.]
MFFPKCAATHRRWRRTIIECLQRNDADQAEVLLAQMHENPDTRDFLIFPVTIALLRGRPHDAWQLVNGLPDDRSPELKALCLKMLGDPSWYGYATAHEDSPDQFVRQAMRKLLDAV